MKLLKHTESIFSISLLFVGYFFMAKVYLAYFGIIELESGIDFGDLIYPILLGIFVPIYLSMLTKVSNDTNSKILFYLSLPLLFATFLVLGIFLLMIFVFSSV